MRVSDSLKIFSSPDREGWEVRCCFLQTRYGRIFRMPKITTAISIDLMHQVFRWLLLSSTQLRRFKLCFIGATHITVYIYIYAKKLRTHSKSNPHSGGVVVTEIRSTGRSTGDGAGPFDGIFGEIMG